MLYKHKQMNLIMYKMSNLHWLGGVGKNNNPSKFWNILIMLKKNTKKLLNSN